jgi:hypothetical protein
MKSVVTLILHTWTELYSHLRGRFAFYISMMFGLQFTILNKKVQTVLCAYETDRGLINCTYVGTLLREMPIQLFSDRIQRVYFFS